MSPPSHPRHHLPGIFGLDVIATVRLDQLCTVDLSAFTLNSVPEPCPTGHCARRLCNRERPVLSLPALESLMAKKMTEES
jgi:hypothetical protein